MGIIEIQGYNDLFFHEEIPVIVNSFLNLSLPPIFDEYDEPLWYTGGEHSGYDINPSLDFSHSPKFDVYGDGDKVDESVKAPIVCPIHIHQECYVVDSLAEKGDSTLMNSSYGHRWFVSNFKELCDAFDSDYYEFKLFSNPINNTFGSRGFPMSRRTKLPLLCVEKGSSSLLVFAILFILLFGLFIFDPGGAILQELRTILF